MSTPLARQRLVNQNENSNIIPNKMMTTEIRKKSKLTLGKGGSGLKSRKVLGDITNRPKINQEASTRKKILPKEEFSILEEKFLHDHNKCIEAQKAMPESEFLDIVLPGRDNPTLRGWVKVPLLFTLDRVTKEFIWEVMLRNLFITLKNLINLAVNSPMLSEFPVSDPSKIDHDTFPCYPKHVELPMPEFSDWLGSTPRPDSPLHMDSPPSSPRSWIFEEVEYQLKTESDD